MRRIRDLQHETRKLIVKYYSECELSIAHVQAAVRDILFAICVPLEKDVLLRSEHLLNGIKLMM